MFEQEKPEGFDKMAGMNALSIIIDLIDRQLMVNPFFTGDDRRYSSVSAAYKVLSELHQSVMDEGQIDPLENTNPLASGKSA